ncbi:hypothetical protein Tco_0678717 [Tanacetum coccineum]|uniref:Aminotransferase-like plant mobile domain-containing protein n=1 Tax=Tanacetum coccineum TaxID=301880 RepID=A0ABQ4XFU6_9ASTR
MSCLPVFVDILVQTKMADENISAPTPIKSYDQILPFAAWVPIGKSNFVLDLQKKQKNPIFQISVDILQNTNFFKAFTALASLDETRFTLDANLLREALEITPIDQAHQFVSPPSGDAIMEFVNKLGYDRPRYLVLQMLWGIITSTNVDFVELMWEEFVQAIHTFLTDKANLGSPTKKGKKDKPHVILYFWFTKLIICHLGRIHNIHQRSTSPFHLAEEDFILGNLKFVPKGEVDEFFGMPIPNELSSNNIRNASYYNAYLEMVAKHDQKVAAKKEGKKKTTSTKQPKSKSATEKPSKPAPASKPKPAKEKPSKPLLLSHPSRSLPNLHPYKRPARAHGHAHVRGVAIQEPVAEAIRPIPVVEGKGKAIVTEEQVAQSLLALHTLKRRSTTDQFIFQRRTHATEEVSTGPSTQPQDDTSTNIVRDSPSSANAETGAGSDKTNNGGDTEILQITDELGEDAGSNPGETHESRPPPEQVLMDEDKARPDPGISRVAFAGPDPEPTHDEFMADLYSKVQESLKFPADKHVILEDPLSSTRTLSSMKNLEDAYAIEDYTTESELVERVTALEKKFSDLEQTNKNLDNPTWNLGSRVYTLELRDLPHKIDEVVHENVKEAVQIALQAPLRDHFRDLSEEDMKEMLHQRMLESGTYKSLPEHIALYEALEAPIERAQRDEFLAKKDKSRKRHRDDQDPPPPPDLDLNAPSISSKQQSGPHAEQPVEDIPIPDSANISDSEDTDSAHLPKIKQMPKWLKPIPDDERPATPEPAWVIPTSHIPDAVNNWANALATTYQAPVKNSLLEKTRDMRTFMNWYCQQKGKTELTQVDFEGQAFEVVTAFYPDVGSKHALSISNIKAARYLDFGLELLVPEHMWINEVVRTYLRILSVVRIKAYSRYGYDYLKEITLHRVDYQEYTIAEKDFKNLYPNDFEDLNLMLLQGHLNHLPGSDKRMLSTAVNLWIHNLVIRQGVKDFQLSIKSYQKQLNLTKSGWDAKGFEYKHNYTIIKLPRAVVFPVARNSYMSLNGNSRPEGSSETWNALLVDVFAILTIDFFREWNDLFIPFIRSKCENKGIVPTEMELELEQTQQGSSHKDSVQVKMEMKIPRSSGVYFITACSYSTDTSNDVMKAQVRLDDDDVAPVKKRFRSSSSEENKKMKSRMIGDDYEIEATREKLMPKKQLDHHHLQKQLDVVRYKEFRELIQPFKDPE